MKDKTNTHMHEHNHHDHAKSYIDPVCGMSTEDEHGFTPYEHNGQIHYFCSDHCLKKFKSNPENFLSDESGSMVEETEEKAASNRQYTCPMHPEILQDEPGSCPKCGMALEPLTPAQPTTRTEYTCPMHPEIVQDEPGSCPKCGMALEPVTITLDDNEKNPEYDYMYKRFLFGAILTVPLVIIAMREMLPGGHIIENFASGQTLGWLELILATPVVLWAGWVFYVRAVQSVINKSLNMFTLIGLGVSVAYIYSLIAVLFPEYSHLLCVDLMVQWGFISRQLQLSSPLSCWVRLWN